MPLLREIIPQFQGRWTYDYNLKFNGGMLSGQKLLFPESGDLTRLWSSDLARALQKAHPLFRSLSEAGLADLLLRSPVTVSGTDQSKSIMLTSIIPTRGLYIQNSPEGWAFKFEQVPAVPDQPAIIPFRQHINSIKGQTRCAIHYTVRQGKPFFREGVLLKNGTSLTLQPGDPILRKIASAIRESILNHAKTSSSPQRYELEPTTLEKITVALNKDDLATDVSVQGFLWKDIVLTIPLVSFSLPYSDRHLVRDGVASMELENVTIRLSPQSNKKETLAVFQNNNV